ncbi:hypothetical protein Tco_0150403 [Tanacetum coccineum]
MVMRSPTTPPIVTKTIDGKETIIPPTSVEKKAQRKADMKARSRTSLDPPWSDLELHRSGDEFLRYD